MKLAGEMVIPVLFTCHHPSPFLEYGVDVITVPVVNIAGGSQQDDANMPNNTWSHATLLQDLGTHLISVDCQASIIY